MKILKYNLCARVNHGTEEEPEIVETLSGVEMTWSEANEAIARREAYNGIYTIEDVEMPMPEPTTDAVLNVMLGVTE